MSGPVCVWSAADGHAEQEVGDGVAGAARQAGAEAEHAEVVRAGEDRAGSSS